MKKILNKNVLGALTPILIPPAGSLKSPGWSLSRDAYHLMKTSKVGLGIGQKVL